MSFSIALKICLNKFLVVCIVLSVTMSVAQNGLIGNGFSSGWNNPADIISFNDGAGDSRITTLSPNALGLNYFRLVTNWDGNNSQWGPETTAGDLLVGSSTIITDLGENYTAFAYSIDAIDLNYNYVFKTRNGGNPVTVPQEFIVFEIQGAVRTITSVAQDPFEFTILPDQDITITATLDEALNNGQAVYLRYTTDNFTSSTIIPMNCTGTSCTEVIPAAVNVDDADIQYYVFTSGTDDSNAALNINHNDADFYTINLNNNENNNYDYSVRDAYMTDQDGDFNNPATWVDDVLPPSNLNTTRIRIDHDVHYDIVSDFQAFSIEITSFGRLYSDVNSGNVNLTIGSTGNITNNGILNFETGTVNFQGAASITGSNPRVFNDVTLFNLSTVLGVDFGTDSTINGELTITNEASVNIGSPIYGPNSTLIYQSNNDAGDPYIRRSEWSNFGLTQSPPTNQGTPHHVILRNTHLDMGGDNNTDPAVMNGNLIIEDDGYLYMDYDPDDMTAPLVVRGNFENYGTISLSDDSGGDLSVSGDFTNYETGTINFGIGNNRAIFFEGGAVQQYNTPNQQLEIPFLVINKNAGEVVLNNDVSVIGNGPGLQMQDNGILNLNGNNLVLGENAGDSPNIPTTTNTSLSFDPNAFIKGSDNSLLTLKGNANMGGIRFDPSTNRTTNALGNIFLDKEGGDVDFSNPVYLKEGITLTSGTLNSNGNLVFVSDSTNTAIVREVPSPGGGSISNDVVIERHFPLSGLQRSFRYISPSAETSTSIHANWQEDASNATTADLVTDPNFNPEPGFGTHITGSQGPVGQVSAEGLDMTETGNYSLYIWDETTQDWSPVTSTIDDSSTMTVENTLAIEDAFALMVRGDRSATLLSNTDEGSNPATIRTRGTIHTGNFSYSFNSLYFPGDLDKFVLVGNPYQSQVDMRDVFANTGTAGVNTNFVWVWDPTIQDKGAYAVVDLSSGLPEDINGLPSSSDANEFLQPFQAVFVQVEGSAPQEINFEENDKDNGTTQTTVFSDQEFSNTSKIEIDLFNTEENEIVDAVRFNFGDNYGDAVSYEDAVKFWNYDENFAILENDKYLSIDKRTLPTGEKVIPLFISGYNSNDYAIDFELINLSDTVNLYLEDTYLNTLTPLDTNHTEYQFTIDFSIPESYDAHRFQLIFNPQTLSIEDSITENKFNIYPNPSANVLFVDAANRLVGEKAEITCFDLSGRLVYSSKISQLRSQNTLDFNQLSEGLYLLQIKTSRESQSFKLQINR